MRAVQCAWTLGHGINIEIVVVCLPSPISMLQPMWDCLQVECLLHQRRGSYSVCTAGFDILRFVAEIQLLPALTLHSIFSHFIFLFKVKQKQQKWATISDIHSSSQQATIDSPVDGVRVCIISVSPLSAPWQHHIRGLASTGHKSGFLLNFFVIGFFRLAIERTIEITLVTCIYL